MAMVVFVLIIICVKWWLGVIWLYDCRKRVCIIRMKKKCIKQGKKKKNIVGCLCNSTGLRNTSLQVYTEHTFFFLNKNSTYVEQTKTTHTWKKKNKFYFSLLHKLLLLLTSRRYDRCFPEIGLLVDFWEK